LVWESVKKAPLPGLNARPELIPSGRYVEHKGENALFPALSTVTWRERMTPILAFLPADDIACSMKTTRFPCPSACRCCC